MLLRLEGERIMANEFEIIEQAILQAKTNGLLIVRGPQFIWSENGQPVACDAFGAVQLAMGKPGFYKGWLREVCLYLNVDTFWFWRFTMGFNYLQKLILIIGKGEKKDKEIQDDVSRKAVALAKKYVGKP